MKTTQKVLFIDRDGTLIREPDDYQVDSFAKLSFRPQVFTYLGRIARELNYQLVMVTNQDGLGTASFPEEDFYPVQDLIIRTLAGEGIEFAEVLIDRTYARDEAPTRKPRTGLLTRYLEGDYDLANSFVIGDRASDMELAENLGTKAIFIKNRHFTTAANTGRIDLVADGWREIYEFLKLPPRRASHRRKTGETDILVELNLDGRGRSEISTGIGFFDHMLEQLAHHGSVDLKIAARGDLEIDEHHTIEDVAITLGEAFALALGDKRGIGRYGFCLPMDDCLAQVAVDFGGRNWCEWDAEFKREMIGQMPTEMFFHFFKSFSDRARCNLNIRAEGDIEHHKIEAIFKAFARAVRAAVSRGAGRRDELPSTKGTL